MSPKKTETRKSRRATNSASPPADQAARDRFVRELDRNFSVIAAAGAGKTKALVDRVIALATGDLDRARAWLPRLVVVTYTRKAADEMHQRARNELVARGVDLSVLAAFRQAFFGTIHSFCLHLLRRHGHRLGLPPALELPEDEEALWAEFRRQGLDFEFSLPAEWRKECLRYRTFEDILALARAVRPGAPVPQSIGPPPEVDLEPLLDFQGRGNVAEWRRRVRAWQEARERGDPFVGFPEVPSRSAPFQALLRDALEPLRQWTARCALVMARDVAQAYRRFRLQRRLATYDDQIELATELIRHPEIGPRLREERYRILLDEAQDTDPLQFDLLLELARPPEATGRWLEVQRDPPEPGRFCMVGDPQQSIYSDRADLAYYERVRRLFVETHAGEELVFHVTFRCDCQIVAFVNRFAPAMLDGERGQAAFVELQARPGAGRGQVTVLEVPPPPDRDRRPKVGLWAEAEAQWLAQWIAAQGLERLRASAWSEVAVLCPRRRWFAPFARALRAQGLRAQIHSPREERGVQPAYAWFAALMTVAARPRDAFELVGVLREIFGVSDQALADFARGDGSRFQIETETPGNDEVATALNQLARARQTALRLPLREAAEALVNAVHLRERLRAVAEFQMSAEAELDALLVRTAAAEAARLSLAQWAEELVREFSGTVETQPVEPDAVQLITCQKAKGLQWDAVIVPLLARKIESRAPYPMLLASSAADVPEAVFSADEASVFRETLEERRRQELERILYVSLTRARHTLVLVDDRSWIPSLPSPCWGKLLRWDSVQADELAKWRARLEPERAARPPPAPRVPTPPPWSAAALEAARRRAGDFPRRTLPSSLARHVLPEEPEFALGAAAEAAGELLRARDYGTWWHELMEWLDWPAGPEVWTRRFRDALADCPLPERATREWDLFLRSDVARRLSDPRLVVHTEIPFLWKKSPQECLEGFADLAAWDPRTGEWLVVDWKTSPETARLREIYGPQIAAYLEALKALTGQPARGGLYATTTGEWIPYA